MAVNYAQINAEGIAFSVIMGDEEINAPDMIALPEFDHSIIGKRWNAAMQRWDAAPTDPETRRISTLAFRRRFTAGERAAIEWAAVDRSDQPEPARQQAAALRATLADQAAAAFIDLDDDDTDTGVRTLEALGLLIPGRAAQILGAPVQAGEQ